MKVQKFGGSPPKNSGANNMQISVDFTQPHTLIANSLSQERLKISKIGKLIDREQFLPRSNKKVRLTLIHKLQRSIHVSMNPLKCTFLGDYISALRGCFDLKFLHTLEIHQPILAHIATGMGVPQKS